MMARNGVPTVCTNTITNPKETTTMPTIDEMNEGVRRVRDRRAAIMAAETTSTVDEAVRDAVHDVQAVRQAKALLELREAARAHAGITDTDARQACEEAVTNRVAAALDNGATMAQVAAMMADGAGIDREQRQRLRRLTSQVPAGFGGMHDHTATMDELLDSLEAAIESNRRVCESYEQDRQSFQQLKADVTAMRRVLGVTP